MKAAIIAVGLCLIAQVRAYEGTLNVLKYAGAVIDDAKNQSSIPNYPGELSVAFLGPMTEYLNISQGSLEEQDDFISLESASYILDKHGKALAVIVNFNILPHKVKYTYSVSYNKTAESGSGTALVNVDGYLMSSIISFTGSSYPVNVRSFANSVSNETLTSDSKNSLVTALFQSHWEQTGKGKLQQAYITPVESAVSRYDINKFFS